jgi:hypothetical protein
MLDRPRNGTLLRPAVALLVFPALGAVNAATQADTGDVGFRDHSFGLASSTTNSGLYSSREGAHPPELVLTTG